MKRLVALFTFMAVLLLPVGVFGLDTCSRTAIINYQEVLVDTDSTQKGEGLRYHLKKDPEAKSFLDIYQKGTGAKWTNAALGTIGTMLILTGFLTSGSKNSKRSFWIGGGSIIALNFLVAKTVDHKNEENLQSAIEEYNKRNLPRIYYDPLEDKKEKDDSGIVINFTKDF